MKIVITWSGTDSDRAQAQTAQYALEAAGLADVTEYLIEGRRPSV